MVRLAIHAEQGAMQLSEISKAESISEKYLGQIVIQLKSSGLLNSIRGAQGGYYLAREPRRITALEVVESLEGSLNPVDCLDTNDCDKIGDCTTRKLWDILASRIRETLGGVTLADLVDWYNRDSGKLVFDI
jgi:Rrf2 family protein